MRRSRWILSAVTIAIVVVAGLVVYSSRLGGGRQPASETTQQPNVHNGVVDLAGLTVGHELYPNGSSSYFVVPLNLTINYNASLYVHDGAESAVLEYLTLNYSWSSVPRSSTPSVSANGYLTESSCSSSTSAGSIYVVIGHIVSLYASVGSTSNGFTGSFSYSYKLTRFPVVTTIINNGAPDQDLAQAYPWQSCLASTQATHPVFTYSLKAPTLPNLTFQGWTGFGAGSYTGTMASVALTISGNVTESASYS